MTKQNATKSSDNRARIWAAVVYPDSAPENWRQLLDDLHIEWVESPLHDRDVNETTGELKKAHWHIVLSLLIRYHRYHHHLSRFRHHQHVRQLHLGLQL